MAKFIATFNSRHKKMLGNLILKSIMENTDYRCCGEGTEWQDDVVNFCILITHKETNWIKRNANYHGLETMIKV